MLNPSFASLDHSFGWILWTFMEGCQASNLVLDYASSNLAPRRRACNMPRSQ